MSARPSRRLRNVLVVVLILAALYTAYRYTLHRMVEARLDEIRKQGYPVTIAELDKWYPQPPPGENAADIYLAAFAKFNKWNTNTVDVLRPPRLPRARHRSDGQVSAPALVLTTVEKRDLLPLLPNGTKLPPRTEALSNSVQILIADYLADNAESLKLFHRAASVKECRYPIDLARGFELSLPHLNEVRLGAQQLALEAILKSEKGDSEASGNAIIDDFALAHSLEKEPLLISQLVHVACQGIALTGLERLLNRTTPSDVVLSQLATATSDAEASETMIRGIVGEMSCYVSLFGMSVGQLTAKGELPLPGGIKNHYLVATLVAVYEATGLMDMDELSCIHGMVGYIDACRKPLPSRLTASEACSASVESLPKWRYLTRIFLPSLNKSQVREASSIARLRAARIALAMERYRLANDALPDSLNNLVPKFLDAVPTDPFDGLPLRYKKLSKGYVVYSVGEDGKDDGGDEKKDITFTVER